MADQSTTCRRSTSYARYRFALGARLVLAAVSVSALVLASPALAFNADTVSEQFMKEAARYPQGHPFRSTVARIGADILYKSPVPNPDNNCDTRKLERNILRLKPLIATLSRSRSPAAPRQLARLKALRDSALQSLVAAKVDCDRKRNAGAAEARAADQDGKARRSDDQRGRDRRQADEAEADAIQRRINVVFNIGFRSQGSTNNSATTVQQGGNIVGAGTTGSSSGFSTNLDVEFRITRDMLLSFNVETFQGSGSSTSTDAGAIGYIPYVNGNPLVGLGQSGVSSRTSTETFMKQMDMTFEFGIPGLGSLGLPLGSRNPEQDMLASHKALHRSGGGGLSGGWKFGLFGGAGLRLRHTSLNEGIGMNAVTIAAGHHTKLQTRSTFIGPKFMLGVKAAKAWGAGTLFGSLTGVFAPGVSIVDGRADQSIRVLGDQVNPTRSARGSRGNFQTSIAGTVGYTFWGIRAGLTGRWSWEANRPFMRMPVNTGGARIAYRPVHSFAIQAFVKIPLP